MIVEDTPEALDTGIFEGSAGSPSKRAFVPQSVAPPKESIPGPAPIEPGPSINHSMPDFPADDFEVPSSIKQPKRQYHYLKEFASRVDELLQTLLAREALPNEGRCAECANHQPGRWRCKDCTMAPLLCRSCMRHSHTNNPLHQIQFWTGNHFRDAALWEVGAFILVPHCDEPHLCPTLTWQSNMLETLQSAKDKAEAMDSQNYNPSVNETSGTGFDEDDAADDYWPEGISAERLAADDMWFTQQLDSIYEKHDNPDMLEDDEENDLADADVFPNPTFAHYMPEPDELNTEYVAEATMPDRPTRDALNNQYVRVIHSNGVHHIGLVSCSCQGSDRLPFDLMHAGFVATSFKRIRTLFTISVLDFFRYSNLEMKASAYQFFQLLRRITIPFAPAEVVNFYHELRRLSRTWRWMKRLKWAGIGHKQTDAMKPALGELSVFCPACPQIGINVAANWLDDPRR